MRRVNSLRGVECVFANDWDVRDFLSFSGIDLANHYFSVVDDSMFMFLNGKPIKLPSQFSPAYFQDLMHQPFWGQYFILHLYPEGSPTEEIDTYEDFLHSHCEMIVLLYDRAYVEIYCKDSAWTQILFQRGTEIPGAHVTKKYDDTDTRTEMYV